MKINLNKIPEEVLGDIRQNARAKDENDTSHDAILAAESPRQLLKRYAEWHLGDGGWGISAQVRMMNRRGEPHRLQKLMG